MSKNKNIFCLFQNTTQNLRAIYTVNDFKQGWMALL